MYLVDTNVLSEARRREKTHPAVRRWMQARRENELLISAITVMELEIGHLRLARRDAEQAMILDRWLRGRILPDFAGRILPVDGDVALRCATLHVPDPKPDRDALIAATAFVHRLTVVTRNVADFEKMGVPLLNPWDA